MNVRPLRGMCLVEMLPAEAVTSGGITIPEQARIEPTTDLGRHKTVAPRGHPLQGIVVAIGEWPLVKKGPHKGFAKLPEFAIGNKVIVGAGSGQQLTRGFGERYKLVHQSRVLAVIENHS